MTEFVLTEQSARTPIGEVLRLAGTDELRLVTAAGESVGRLTPAGVEAAGTEPLPDGEELAELRRRMETDPADCLTLPQLLERLRKRTDEALLHGPV